MTKSVIEKDLTAYFEVIEKLTSGGSGYPGSCDYSNPRVSSHVKRDVVPHHVMPAYLAIMDRAMCQLHKTDPLIYRVLQVKHHTNLPVNEKAIAARVSQRHYFQLVREGLLYLKGAYTVGEYSSLKRDLP